MVLDIYNDPLFRAVDWLEINDGVAMSDKAKLGELLVTFGGSYSPQDPERMRIAGVAVSCTGGTGNLLRAWKWKAENKLNAAQAGAS